MPSVAAAAGAGVASVYRQFPSKRELLAALVVSRLDQIVAGSDRGRAASEAMLGRPWSRCCGRSSSGSPATTSSARRGSPWPTIPRCAGPPTAPPRRWSELLSAARAEGQLSADATTLDLKLLFAATRAAKQLEPTAWPRMLELADRLAASDAAREQLPRLRAPETKVGPSPPGERSLPP